PMEYALFSGHIIDIDYVSVRKGRKKILVITVGDNTGRISCKWFNFNEKYMKRMFKPGTKVFVSGTTSLYGGRLEIHHPDMEIVEDEMTEDKIHFGRIVPIYSETEGLTQKLIRRILFNVVNNYSAEVTDYIPPELAERLKLPSLGESIKKVHFPDNDADVDQLRAFRSRWQKRLIFDEFFIIELALVLRRKGIKKRDGIAFQLNDVWLDFIESKLPFKLTNSQMKVISEILNDMQTPEPMNRLIQGDVGSGKTVVAFYAAAIAILNGYQAAMMAPTEILAEQHYSNFKKLFDGYFNAELLISSITKKNKTRIKQDIESGKVHFVIGTQALIQEDVGFANLGLVIVDEQHRFGVEQRLSLVSKGMPDMLVMTATPIPRTLAMTVYGDLDISIIDEKPKGRKPVITKFVYDGKRGIVYDFIREELKKGRQAYFIYPLVEESEKLLLKDAKAAARKLSEEFKGYNVLLMHGRMRQEEKDAVMQEFKEGRGHILVSTTVVEVGIDVPNATVMFIEHPERFGLSQLHQLRGRIGRGDERSCCILMAGNRISEQAYKRLQIMVSTDDGFKIAEQDLAIRGPGEFLGTRQHGLPGFRIGNLLRDMDTLILARNEAVRLVEKDPELLSTPNKKIRSRLLQRFDSRIDMMDAG
ncbi:MAG: ATP-dependent DNA helicase RecG, partial [Oligoflexia bacterium]|nr:ATP-dependent DNA helicase RecG [Oligoflexia bacterium]